MKARNVPFIRTKDDLPPPKIKKKLVVSIICAGLRIFPKQETYKKSLKKKKEFSKPKSKWDY